MAFYNKGLINYKRSDKTALILARSNVKRPS